jgi:hypothetical protein
MGYIVLFIVAVIATYDFFRVLGRFYNFLRNRSPISTQNFWKRVISRQLTSSAANCAGSTAEYSPFRNQEGDDDDDEQSRLVTDSPEQRYDSLEHGNEHEFHDVDFHDHKDMGNHDDMTDEKPKSVRMSYMRHSYHSEHSMSSTLRDEPLSPNLSSEPFGRRLVSLHNRRVDTIEEYEVADMEDEPKDSDTRTQRALSWLVYLAEWSLVAFAYVELITGTVVYSGICRATYTPGCLAHLISKFTCTQLLRPAKTVSTYQTFSSPQREVYSSFTEY